MEETVKEVAEIALPQVNQLAVSLMNYLESGMELAREQAPLFINEILSWAIFYGCFCAVFDLLLMIAAVIFTLKIFKLLKREVDKEKDSSLWIPFSFVVLIPIIVGFISLNMFVDNSLHVAKAFFAPRLFLVDYLNNLIN